MGDLSKNGWSRSSRTDKVRENRIYLLRCFIPITNQYAKTGSGQTYGKALKKRDAVFAGGARHRLLGGVQAGSAAGATRR
jgi:hypothetical protein